LVSDTFYNLLYLVSVVFGAVFGARHLLQVL